MPKSSLVSRMLYYYLKHTEATYRKPIDPARENISLYPPKKLCSNYSIELKKNTEGRIWICETQTAEDDDSTILYFYGSGLIQGPRKQHWKCIEDLLQRGVPRIVLVEAPLFPSHTISSILDWCLETTMEIVHELVIKENRLKMLGEGSGAWLAYNMLHNFEKKHLLQVDELILLCPWLDASLSNPWIDEVEVLDPINNRSEWTRLGEIWQSQIPSALENETADGILKNPTNPLAPIYMDLRKTPPTRVYTAEYDIFKTDAVKLRQKAASEPVIFNYYEYEKMIHCWYHYDLPESRVLLDQLAATLTQPMSEWEKTAELDGKFW
jgi:acetyl esterase/lipase